jgi:cytochrome c peroxidase
MRLLLVLICPFAFGTEQELGERLFFDKQLSIDGTISCATCHIPEKAFTDTRQPKSTGIDGSPLLRNTPTLLNIADRAVLFHDGRESNLDTQALTPLLNKKEMANPNPATLITRISDDY